MLCCSTLSACFFYTECVIKIVAEGVHPWRYLYYKKEGGVNRWNAFDFIIVVMGFLGGAGVFGANGSIVMVLRLLRLLRVLKLVRALPQLQVIVSALISGAHYQRAQTLSPPFLCLR